MPTQKELAKLAGVSSGTVSNVISGSVPVGERSREKVLKAIRELNYQPNLIARSLRTNRTHTVGIIVPDITIPFFPKVIRGAESAARERGYFVVVAESEGSSEREAELIALLRSQRVDGILLIVAAGAKRPPLSSSDLPVVYLDRLPDGFEVDSVCVDDRAAAEMGIVHLLSMGHRRIAILTGPLTLKNEQERLRGYRQAFKKSGVPVQESLIWSSSFNLEEVMSVCQKGLLKPRNRPTALFTTNGLSGMGALRSIIASGLSTPRDIAFVTFDELTSEDIFRPAITSIVQPASEIGSRGMEILIDRINTGSVTGPRKKIRLPAMLAVRESSGVMLQKRKTL
ncbi:LacI family transcriptional regulator [Granulicella sp. WH15]|uniref:LacI family DNA-binding transcriptional regulator n=1 Tax=Granulicella sp. WH15 TaxID=2602070 RepID=UPI001366EFF5|nr:LacI family DNA-binding transcriptional regulator [Granulicella sp. WH15]QHN03208.1 LacI family transcriptional regulator [Granulicella sp. WH15]